MESKMDSSSPYHILISCVVFSCIRKLLTLLKPFNFLIYYGCTTAPVKKMDSLWGDDFLIHSLALTHIIFYCQRTLGEYNYHILWAFKFQLEFTETYKI